MSFPLRSIPAALGLGALACSGEAPTSPASAPTAGLEASVTPNAPAESYSCQYWATSGEFGPYIVQVNWSGLSVMSLYFTKTGTSSTYTYDLRHPTQSQNMSIVTFPFDPTGVELRNRKDVARATATCGLTTPP